MRLFQNLPVSTQTLFANIDQAARSAQMHRTIADLPGGVTWRTVKGRRYLYYQVKDPDGRPRQIYLGPEGDETAIQAAAQDVMHLTGLANLAAMSRAAIELGCSALDTAQARVLRRLANHGFFCAGAVLVGPHAFFAYQNMLGVRWIEPPRSSDGKTSFVDRRDIRIALAGNFAISSNSAIDSLRRGILPCFSRTRFTKADEDDLKLEFLTPRVSTRRALKPHDALNIALQPAPVIDCLMDKPLDTGLLTRTGPSGACAS